MDVGLIFASCAFVSTALTCRNTNTNLQWPSSLVDSTYVRSFDQVKVIKHREQRSNIISDHALIQEDFGTTYQISP